MLLSLFLIHIILVHCTFAYPSVVIKAGAQSDQKSLEHHDSNKHGVEFKKGTGGFTSENGFDKDKENAHAQAEDTGKYSQENTDKNHHVDQGESAGEKFHQEKGGSVADFGSQEAHKKGHHKSGFHNSYQKDESGSNSSYYDDSEDQGDQYVRNSQQGAYGDQSLQNNRGSHLDGHYDSKEDAKHGGYNKGGGYQRDHGDNRNYDKGGYYDNHENGGSAASGNQYGASGGYSKEQHYDHHPHPHYAGPHYHKGPHYYEKPHYYDSPNYYEPAPYNSYDYPQKKTITIYEDPRVYDNTYKNYNSDSVELDVRPPIKSNNFYYDDLARDYDSYYY